MSWSNLLMTFWWLIIPLGFAAVGALGLLLDADHRKNLAYRRAQFGNVMVTDMKRPPGIDPQFGSRLVTGDVVLAANRLLTTLRGSSSFSGAK